MLVIFINCVTMAMFRPCSDERECNASCEVLKVIDHVIYGYFVVEMLMKILAMGIFGKLGYLADTWNRLDCFIVLAGAAEYILSDLLGDFNFTIIRTIRVLRPLRAVNRIPSLRILVSLLLDTLPMLGNVAMLCFFVFFVFGIVGLQLWAGLLRNRCVADSKLLNSTEFEFPHSYYIPDYPEDSDYVCSLSKHGGTHTCENLAPMLNHDGIPCNGSIFNSTIPYNCIDYNQYFNVCQATLENPFGGAISFDNILQAMVTIFVSISMDGWVDIMYHVQEAYSNWSWLYFILLIVVGSFYMVNLFLAVIATQFAETKSREMKKIETEKTMEKLDDALTGEVSKEKKAAGSLKSWLSKANDTWQKVKKRKNPVDVKKLQEPPDVVKLSEVFTDVFESFNSLLNAAELENDGEKEAVNRLALEALKFGSLPGFMNLNRPKPIRNPAAVTEILDKWKTLKDKDLVLKYQPIEMTFYQRLIHRFQSSFLNFVEGSFFTRLVMLAIICNTLSMAIEHHKQKDQLTDILEVTNYFFTAFFALEMVLKILAFGPLGYLKDGFNIFDGTIVILSLVELGMGGESGLSVLRAFRLLRVFKLVRFIPSLRYQLVVMLRCLGNVRVFFILLLLFIFIFTLLGMVLFGAKFCDTEDGDKCSCDAFLNGTCHCTRDNFDSFFHASLTVFVILSGTYADVLFEAMSRLGAWTSIYFIALVVFGNYIMLNLLICILLEEFEETDETAVNEELEPHHAALKKRDFNQCSHKQALGTPLETQLSTKTWSEYDRATTSTISGYGKRKWDRRIMRIRNHGDYRPPQTVSKWGNAVLWQNTFWTQVSNKVDSTDEQDFGNMASTESTLRYRRSVASSYQHGKDSWNKKKEWKRHLIESRLHPQPPPYCPVHGIPGAAVWPFPDYLDGFQDCVEDPYEEPDEASCFGKRVHYSLYIFSEDNCIRQFCQNLISQKRFDHLILIFIGLNCLTFTMERPTLAEDSWQRQLLTISNYVFTGIFTLEMMVKVVARGLIFGSDAYFKDRWNMLDGTLVIVSWISLIFDILISQMDSSQETPGIFSLIRVLRLLRALRPLRVVNRSPGLKLVVETLISSLKPIGSVLLICLLFFTIFAILGVQLFKGKFYFCDGPEVGNVTNKTECEAVPENTWVRHQYNFDDIVQAMLLLFVLSTLDNWNELLYQGMDVVGVDQQPQENYSRLNALFYIVFVMFVGFFVLNMFVGVVVENFQQNSKAQEVDNKDQKKLTVQKSVVQILDFEHAGYLSFVGGPRRSLYHIVSHRYFDLAIAAVIMLNVATMALEFYQMPDQLIEALQICNYIFTAVFALEAFLKIFVLGRHYFRDK